MKSISPALQAHLRQQVTTICTCITIRRQIDHRSFYFTDHDQPVIYANQSYQPYESFARFSIVSSSDMDVDALEIKGIIGTTSFSRDDISSGLFDFSEIEVFVVNYNDPTMGRGMLRRGWLGEFVMDESGVFTAEIRGLSQIYAYRVGDVYQPECRADLGDRLCKLPLDPPVWQPLEHYCEGAAVLGHIDRVSAGYINLGFQNPSFEDDGAQLQVEELTGWTTYGDGVGRWAVHTDTFRGVPVTKFGSYYAIPVNFTDPETNVMAFTSTQIGAYQDVGLVEQGALTADLDTGLCRLNSSVWVCCSNADAKFRFRVYALDQNSRQIAVIYDTGDKAYAEDRWVQESFVNVLLPIGTRRLRFDLLSMKPANTVAGVAFDNLTAAMNTPSGSVGNTGEFGGVVFIAQNDGDSGATEPAFSNLIGSTITDGTVTWKAVKGWKTVSTVAAVSSARSFVPTALSDPAGWYDGGILVWETGRNAGRVQEIKSWDGGFLTLFLRPFYTPAIGDRFVLHPGCDKTRSTCSTKFSNILNFRGEPDVPGMDQYMSTPNADGSTTFFVNAGVAQ
jgi:hypothetical protein